MIFSTEPKILDSKDFHVEIKQVQNWSLNTPQIGINITDSTVNIDNATITEIIRELGVGTNQYMIVDNCDLKKYDFKAVLNNNFDIIDLKDSLIKRCNIIFDTIERRKHPLSMTFSADVLQGNFEQNCSIFVSVPTLESIVRRRFYEHVINETDKPIICITKEDFDVIMNEPNFSKFVSILAKNGIYINRSDNLPFTVIRSADI